MIKMQNIIISKRGIITYFRIGALARIAFGFVKLFFSNSFVLGSPIVGLEVIGIVIYAHVWALGVIFEQIAILTGVWPAPMSVSNGNAGEMASGVADILAGVAWLLILRGYD